MECLCFQWKWRLCYWFVLAFESLLTVASTVKAAHDIYIWETAIGSLIKILEGPREELIDVDVSHFASNYLTVVASIQTYSYCSWSG